MAYVPFHRAPLRSPPLQLHVLLAHTQSSTRSCSILPLLPTLGVLYGRYSFCSCFPHACCNQCCLHIPPHPLFSSSFSSVRLLCALCALSPPPSCLCVCLCCGWRVVWRQQTRRRRRRVPPPLTETKTRTQDTRRDETRRDGYDAFTQAAATSSRRRRRRRRRSAWRRKGKETEPHKPQNDAGENGNQPPVRDGKCSLERTRSSNRRSTEYERQRCGNAQRW